MNYLAIDLALWERLSGAPCDGRGLPKLDGRIPVNRSMPGIPGIEPTEEDAAKGILSPPRRPSYGVRIPRRARDEHLTPTYQMPNAAAYHAPPSLHNDFSKTNFVQIPVVPHNNLGKRFEQCYPLVSFHWIGQELRSNAFTYDTFFTAPAADAPDVEAGGEVGKDKLQILTTGEPYTLTYGIRVYSRFDWELKLICTSIHQLFPAITSLYVTLADGSEVNYSMRLSGVEELFENRFDIQTTISEERSFGKIFMFEIDAFTDTSLVTSGGGFGQEAPPEDFVIRQRILDMEQVIDGYARHYEFDKENV